MNYRTHHDKIISNAQNRVLEGYGEFHHIIPRCLGGSDDSANLVRLTAREHYVVHQLLVKIYPNNPLLVKAAAMMTIDANGERVNNRLYEWLKVKNAKAHSKLMQGRNTGPQSADHIAKRSVALTGRKRAAFSNSWKTKISEANMGRRAWNKGKTHTEETKELIRLSKLGNTHGRGNRGRPLSTNHKNSISATCLLRGSQKIVRCPHCNKDGGVSLMKRWHFTNCKQNKTNVY